MVRFLARKQPLRFRAARVRYVSREWREVTVSGRRLLAGMQMNNRRA
jgi:hypothetical protein